MHSFSDLYKAAEEAEDPPGVQFLGFSFLFVYTNFVPRHCTAHFAAARHFYFYFFHPSDSAVTCPSTPPHRTDFWKVYHGIYKHPDSFLVHLVLYLFCFVNIIDIKGVLERRGFIERLFFFFVNCHDDEIDL